MNGREIEHLLSLMDENILKGRASLRTEIISYLTDHEDEVLTALRNSGKVNVPTSFGKFEIDLTELEALVA
jgi:hypothetical protein